MMDSGRSGRTPRSLSSSSSIQDSSIFNDITNLSPVRPCNEPSSHLPPLDYVFGSPCHNSQRGASFTQRPQKSVSADAEQSLKENARPSIPSATQGVSQPSISQLGVQSVHCPPEHNSKVTKQVQSCSPSGHTDELLANPLKEFVRFTESPNSQSNQAIDPSKNLQNDLKGTAAEVLVHDNVQKDRENQLAPTTSLLRKVGYGPKGKKPLILGSPTAQGGGKSSVGRADKDVTDLINANLSNQSASGEQHELHLVDQATASVASSMTNTEPDIVKHEEQTSFSSSGFHQLGIEDNLPVKKLTQLGDCDHTPELQPETFDSFQFNNIHNENKRTGNNQIVEYQMRNECKEPDQHHHGICGYRLQFEGLEGGRKSIGSSSNSWNPANIVHSAVPPASPVHPNAFNALNAESNMFSRNKRLANFPHHTSSRFPIYPCRILESHIDKIDISARNNRNSMITGPLPTNIGLHLNRIGNSVAANCGLNVQLTGKDYLSFPGEKSPSGSSHHLADDSMGRLALVNSFGNSSDKLTAKSESSLAYSVRINIELNQDESQASMTANSSNISQTVNKLKPWENSQDLLCESRRTASQDIYALEEFKQMSPRKKRKEEALSVETEGCKRCNCKKSKCLKLYCDCFAAGVYCVDSCSCQECLNKIEYEDTVLATRQHIESRNPLAFAPKIVRRVSEPPQSSREDANWTTQSSARHKRGCNCKKSMCLKKYCECYQAGVGCSDGCRCEGCKNVFGKKEGSGEAMEVEHRKIVDRGPMDSLSDGKMVVQETEGYMSHSGQYISDPSLIAQLYQCSNQDRISSRFQHPAGRHPIPSPQPDNSFLPQGNLNCSETFLKEIKENAAVIPYYPEMHYFEPEMGDPFSPRLKGFADMLSFITSDQHPEPVPGISASFSDRYSSKSSQAPLFHPSSASSLHRPSSTFYQNPHSSGPKFVLDPSFDGSLYNILEGEYPHTPKEVHSTKPENASSADEKHGSPPTNCLEGLGRSVSLPGLGGSRKPIPKRLSFPSQTHKVTEGSDKRSEGSKTR